MTLTKLNTNVIPSFLVEKKSLICSGYIEDVLEYKAYVLHREIP
jgi:hypothetical protein